MQNCRNRNLKTSAGLLLLSLFNDRMSRNQINDTLRSVLLEFCEIPRSKKEISEKMGIKTESYVKRTYIDPLGKGASRNDYSSKPGSRKQKYQKQSNTGDLYFTRSKKDHHAH